MEKVHVAYSTWSEISSSNGRYSCWRWKVSRITLFMHNSRDAHIGKFSHRIWIFGGEFCKFRNRSVIAPVSLTLYFRNPQLHLINPLSITTEISGPSTSKLRRGRDGTRSYDRLLDLVIECAFGRTTFSCSAYVLAISLSTQARYSADVRRR